jgi:6-phosphogluconolactonase
MKKLQQHSAVLAAALAVSVVLGFAASENSAWAAEQSNGRVFTLDNAASANSILAFDRAKDGALSNPRTYATGGKGTGTALGSQGALAFAEQGHYLLAVNPGSDEVSVFSLERPVLRLLGTVLSGGHNPISITSHGPLVYVLNAGAPANITGFWLKHGELVPISHSTRGLSTQDPAPAQVELSPFGDEVVVTEKATDRIVTFPIRLDGSPGDASIHASNGQTPYGFGFTRGGVLVVSEAAGGASGASSVSSYLTLSFPGLSIFHSLSVSVPDFQTAACWVASTPNGDYAYTSNTGSGTISGYSVEGGRLSLLSPSGITAVTGDGTQPADMGLASQFLMCSMVEPTSSRGSELPRTEA